MYVGAPGAQFAAARGHHGAIEPTRRAERFDAVAVESTEYIFRSDDKTPDDPPSIVTRFLELDRIEATRPKRLVVEVPAHPAPAGVELTAPQPAVLDVFDVVAPSAPKSQSEPSVAVGHVKAQSRPISLFR